MAFMWHHEGQEWLLEVAISEEQSVPENFYLGLYADASPAEADTLVAVTAMEEDGTGYARQLIPSSAAGWTIGVVGNDVDAVGTQETFTAGGTWTEVNRWFLATTADNTGKLICSGDIDPARTLGNTDTLKFTPTLRLKNVGD